MLTLGIMGVLKLLNSISKQSTLMQNYQMLHSVWAKWRNWLNPNAKCLVVYCLEVSILLVKTVQETEIQMFSFGFKLI